MKSLLGVMEPGHLLERQDDDPEIQILTLLFFYLLFLSKSSEGIAAAKTAAGGLLKRE
jgi:hypothetical protein